VCESEISDRTKLRYVSLTVRSWVEKTIKTNMQAGEF